jgi:hypothetical protein
MDEVAACRRATRDAVRDIEPDRLRAVMDDLLAETSLVPGVLTLRVARVAATADGGGAVVVETDGDGVRAVEDTAAVPDHVAQRAAGVQLIYDGLRLIRDLAGADPWGRADAAHGLDGATGSDPLTEENLAVLAADVLVSRGFYLLAHTSAADRAVETVRNFGRDQTLAREETGHEHDLEVDVLRLALAAGVAGTPGVEPTGSAFSTVATIARSGDGLVAAETALAGVSVGLRSGASVEADGEGARTATDP